MAVRVRFPFRAQSELYKYLYFSIFVKFTLFLISFLVIFGHDFILGTKKGVSKHTFHIYILYKLK